MSTTAIILDIGSLATAGGVATAVYQLRLSRHQSLSQFEDSLNNQYRSIVAELPVDAFLADPLPTDQLVQHRSAFYRYFDLCNEQIFLRRAKRISEPTWREWSDGIKGNLSRDAFTRSWSEQFEKQTEGDFDDLRRLMADYTVDPATWPKEARTA